MAKVKMISVKSAGNVGHPNPRGLETLKFAQLKGEVEIVAELGAKDDVEEVFAGIRDTANILLQEHLQGQYKRALGETTNE